MSDTIDDLRKRSIDCPPCPSCGCRVLVPIENATWNHRAKTTDRMACPACGAGCFGDEADLEKAKKAQQAWNLLVEVES